MRKVVFCEGTPDLTVYLGFDSKYEFFLLIPHGICMAFGVKQVVTMYFNISKTFCREVTGKGEGLKF